MVFIILGYCHVDHPKSYSWGCWINICMYETTLGVNWTRSLKVHQGLWQSWICFLHNAVHMVLFALKGKRKMTTSTMVSTNVLMFFPDFETLSNCEWFGGSLGICDALELNQVWKCLAKFDCGLYVFWQIHILSCRWQWLQE